jgi:hypothetical protein
MAISKVWIKARLCAKGDYSTLLDFTAIDANYPYFWLRSAGLYYYMRARSTMAPSAVLWCELQPAGSSRFSHPIRLAI